MTKVCGQTLFLPLAVANERKGNWKGAINIPDMSLAESGENLSGSNKELFLQFMRKMLQWTPEARQSARELLDDSWLRSN